MKLLVLDTETTGIETSKGAIAIELAATLYSVPFRASLQSVSFLMPTDSNPVAHINGIDPRITTLDQPWRTALAHFREMAAIADFALAHYADFDRKFFGIGHLPELHLPWLCSMSDFNWGDMPGRSLRDLALAHGIAVMPDVHRAMPDVTLLTSILSKRTDLEELITEATKPRTLYKAMVSFQQKDRAKDAGFRWDGEAKHWARKLTFEEAHLLREDGLNLARVK